MAYQLDVSVQTLSDTFIVGSRDGPLNTFLLEDLIMRKTRSIILGLAALSTSSVWAAGASAPAQDALDRARTDLARFGGVSERALLEFRARVSGGDSDISLMKPSVDCAALFADNDEARTRFLECLAEQGSDGLNERLFGRLFELRVARAERVPTAEERRSLSLLAYVEDLARAAENRRKQGGFWFVRGQGYMSGRDYLDFPFEDGDVVLGLGNTSLSSTIAAATNPRSRYSHGFVVRKTAAGITTLEALVETGVREFPREHWEADKYQVLTVLRWKDAAQRARIAARASEIALDYARKKTPYDIRIDVRDDSKIFCTELVALAYSKAAGLTVDEYLPSLSRVRSDKAFDYMKQVGVRNREVVAAGDILNSPYMEVMAEWRRADELDRAWKLWLFGDLFYERLERGYTIRPDPVLATAPAAAWVLQLFPSLVYADARVLPASISPWALSVMGTLELHIFRPSVSYFEEQVQKGRAFADFDVADMRAAFDHAFDHHGLIPSVLSDRKTAPRPPKPPHR
jgi:hypothetical protein